MSRTHADLVPAALVPSVMLAITSARAGAQIAAPTTPGGPVPVHGRGLELRPFAGALLPTGTQRDLLPSTHP